MDKIVLIGAGGNCKVIIDILKGRYDIIGVTDIDESKHGKKFYEIDVLGNDEKLRYIYQQGVKNALVSLGSTGSSSAREKLYQYACEIGFRLINAVSKNALISESVRLGHGNIIMNGAIINADAVVGNNTIINTGCIIEHDCLLGDNVHVSVGAKLAGGVTIGNGTFVGMGACIIQGAAVGSNCIIGAGTVVIKDVPDYSVCVGVPARVIKHLGSG